VEGFVFHEESRGNLNGGLDSKEIKGIAGLGRHMPEKRYQSRRIFEKVCVKGQITNKKKLSFLKCEI